MGQNLLPWFCFLTAWTTTVRSSNIQSKCKPPRNALSVTAGQLNGAWYHQVNVDFGSVAVNYACDRVEYLFTTPKTGLAISTVIDLSDGEFKLYPNQVTLMDNKIIRLQPFNATSVNIDLYVLLMNINEFVVSACLVNNGKLLQQYTSVLTRARSTTQAHAIDLLRQTGVAYKQSHFFHNPDICYSVNK